MSDEYDLSKGLLKCFIGEHKKPINDPFLEKKAQYLNNNGYDSDIEHDKRIQKTLKKLDKLEIKKLFNTW